MPDKVLNILIWIVCLHPRIQCFGPPCNSSYSYWYHCMCRLAVSGKQLSAVTVTDPTSRSSPSKPSADLSHLEEEIFAQNGDVEEIFAIDTVSLAGSVHCFIQGLCSSAYVSYATTSFFSREEENGV